MGNCQDTNTDVVRVIPNLRSPDKSRAFGLILSELFKYDKLLGHLKEALDYCRENKAKYMADYRVVQESLAHLHMRMQEQSFQIAVIGKEKCGKSSLLNAWLGCDLLPTQLPTCTYATIEIKTYTSSQNELSCSIEYFTTREFDQLDYSADLSEINSFLNAPQRNIDTDQLKSELELILSDPTHAQAIKKIRIRMSVDPGGPNVSLVEPPCFQHTATLLKDQMRSLIENADVVIFTRRVSPLDCFVCEKDLLKTYNSTKQHENVREKLLVALIFDEHSRNKSSGQHSRDLLDFHERFWSQKGLDSSRVIPLYSLVDFGWSKIKEKNKGKKEKPDEQIDEEYTGLELLNASVFKCALDICQKRLAFLSFKIRDFAIRVCDCIYASYKLDENAPIDLNFDMQKTNKEWFANKWRQIERDFQVFVDIL